ncbi:SMI1/KNR4 family protein [Acrocarpospora catenulata]|uniref:SMI1/KNR4 family protein n=1 Tax=Acrocarpospora catenulata TaxID=2836182 RepID=UPI001BD9C9FA|nr:SMI1/KNR4 family protein [Acrocarpospora catenulata]
MNLAHGDVGDELFARVAAKAAGDRLPRTVTAAEVAEAERSLGFSLPPKLVRLYTEVANGGFGPAYEVLPLVGDGRTAVSSYHDERRTSWPAEVLPLLDWGCGMYAAADCRDPDVPILLFEPNGIEDDWHNAWYVDADSLTAWLETWLAETGWYGEEPSEDIEMAQWAAARERLAE